MKQSELLRKQADMMDMAENHGIDDWMELVTVYAHQGRERLRTKDYLFSAMSAPKFALGVVEGKPVFEGDELWHIKGYKYRVQVIEKHRDGRHAFKTVSYPWIDGDWIENYSWNPPKPKTVMVELTVEDAKEWAKIDYDRSTNIYKSIGKACRKALEAL